MKLDALSAPQTDFSHDTKGDALFAMELVLSLEKLNFSKLRILHDVAAAANDAQMCDFIGAFVSPLQLQYCLNPNTTV